MRPPVDGASAAVSKALRDAGIVTVGGETSLQTENGCYGHSNRFGSVACNFCSRFVSVSVMQAQCMSVVGRVFVLCAHGTDSVVDILRTSIYHGTRTGHECAFWRLHVH